MNEENARLRDEIDKVLRERDEARAAEEHLRAQHQYSIGLSMALEEREKAIRERDLALGRLENEIKAANQARMAEERARESLDELDAAIYECLPSDYDDDSPLDCVEHAADRLRDLAEERDEWRDKFHALNQTAGELCDACGWAFKIPGEPCRCEVVKERDELRADMREFMRQAEDAYALLKPLEDGSDVVERAVGHLLTVLRGRERPGPWAFDAVLRERDEARAERIRLGVEVKFLRERTGYMREDVEERWKRLISGRDEAFRRGAEAMRERCALEVRGGFLGTYSDLPRIEVTVQIEAALRALPIPEES